MAEICVCNQCGHKWLPRGEEEPVACGKCKSPRWNRPKTKK